MSGKAKPYEQFGPYLLFKKLESDALGDLWRAARIENNSLNAAVALRRFTGGDREALIASAGLASQVAPLLTGPSFVRLQTVEVIGGTPCIAWDYSGGRSLRHVVERARGAGAQPNPIPFDQALVIVERVAVSVATTAELRYGADRLWHGALIPQFVWITDDGEIRVGGQELGKGLIASLRDDKVAAEIGRYFSTEYQHSKTPSTASEVYALGAVLYLTVTGHEPPDPTRASAFVQAVRGAKTMNGEPLPDDVRQILEKSLNLDPAARYGSAADMRQALADASSKYGATSFNLAFYLSNLLKKEMESEAADREREVKTNVQPYLQAPAPMPVVAQTTAAPAKEKSKAPLAIAAVVLVAAIGAGAWFMFATTKPVTTAPAPALANATAPVIPKPNPVVPEPIVASASPATDTAIATATTATTTPQLDEAARKRAFEDAVRQKLNEEMMKLQADYTRQLQQQQARHAPLVAAPPVAGSLASSATVAEERGPSAAQLDQQRRESQRTATEELASSQQAPAVQTQSVPTMTTAPVAPPVAPAVPIVREGDVVDVNTLDTAPHRVRDPRVVYPPIAARQHIETTIMASVLVSERGEVLEVKILRGDPRFGFNEAAIRALQGARYSTPIKDGKRVKTWLPQMVQFKP